MVSSLPFWENETVGTIWLTSAGTRLPCKNQPTVMRMLPTTRMAIHRANPNLGSIVVTHTPTSIVRVLEPPRCRMAWSQLRILQCLGKGTTRLLSWSILAWTTIGIARTATAVGATNLGIHPQGTLTPPATRLPIQRLPIVITAMLTTQFFVATTTCLLVVPAQDHRNFAIGKCHACVHADSWRTVA